MRGSASFLVRGRVPHITLEDLSADFFVIDNATVNRLKVENGIVVLAHPVSPEAGIEKRYSPVEWVGFWGSVNQVSE